VHFPALINHGNGSCDGFSPNFPELSDPMGHVPHGTVPLFYLLLIEPSFKNKNVLLIFVDKQ